MTASLDDALVFLKSLLGQPLSEEIKDQLIRNIEKITSAVRRLREENQQLKEASRSNRRVTFSPLTFFDNKVLQSPHVLRGERKSEKKELPPIRPKLIRQRTYDLLEPVFLKKGSGGGKKLPEIRRTKVTISQSPTTGQKPLVNTKQKSVTNIRAQVTSQQSTATNRKIPVTSPKKPPQHKSRIDFNPSKLQPPSDIPTNVFWFPM